MTIDTRFSAEVFEQLGRDSSEANALAKELAAVIASEMAEVVRPAFERIAAELVALGHELVADDVEIDDQFDTRGYAFRDVGKDRGIFDHKLRVHFDTQVCTGYPNEETEDDAIRKYFSDAQESPI